MLWFVTNVTVDKIVHNICKWLLVFRKNGLCNNVTMLCYIYTPWGLDNVKGEMGLPKAFADLV